ncbi:LemA family protein [Streptosporangium lutulentum]
MAAAEDRITRSRRHYNDAVLIYNNAIQMSPADIVAGMGGFSQREYLRDQDEERRPVRAWF